MSMGAAGQCGPRTAYRGTVLWPQNNALITHWNPEVVRERHWSWQQGSEEPAGCVFKT